MRQLTEVIDHMVVAIPQNEEMLLAGLRDIRSSVMTAAPEMMCHWWRETALVLTDHFPYEEERHAEWHRRVVDIWQGRTGPKPDYVIQEQERSNQAR